MSEFKLSPAIECSCGSLIDHISVFYGRTPYSIQCPNCECSLQKIMPSGVGWHLGEKHAIEAWNDYHTAINQFKSEGTWQPTCAQLREYFYRELKQWGHNPR